MKNRYVFYHVKKKHETYKCSLHTLDIWARGYKQTYDLVTCDIFVYVRKCLFSILLYNKNLSNNTLKCTAIKYIA